MAASMTARSSTPEMLAGMGVPVTGRFDEDGREVVLRMKGLAYDLSEFNGARQWTSPLTNGVAILRLRAGASEAEVPLDDAARAAGLASTTFIQSDAPELRSKAASIVKDCTNDLDRALAIAHWVNRAVKKKAAVSMPSSLDVLKEREGDCNEHTYLFVGLARAAGLPSHVRAGIVYKDGSFYYHAWPVVYVGHWLELDPTFGLDELGVRHIALVQGELSSQMKLMSLLGRIRAEVLSCR